MLFRSEGMPSLSCEYFDTPVTYSMEKEDWPASADVIMDVPNGIKSVIVTITGGNSGFASVMEEMSFDKGLELVGNQMINELFGGLGLSVGSPSTNDTYYMFPVGTFFTMMNIYGPTIDADETGTPDGIPCHTFKMKVVDNKDNVVEKDLKVYISK